MKVTGYKLREAIRQQELRASAAVVAFEGSLTKFPDEEKDMPQTVMDIYRDAERAVAQLQVIQMQYNLAIIVDIGPKQITLAEAIKALGGVARCEKMWRQATGTKKSKYDYGDTGNSKSRAMDTVYAKSTITPAQAIQAAQEAAKMAGAYRAAVATGNAQELEISDLDESIFG